MLADGISIIYYGTLAVSSVISLNFLVNYLMSSESCHKSQDVITGASGFIGYRLAQYYRQQHRPCRLLVGTKSLDPTTVVCNLTQSPLLVQQHLAGINCVFHCAGYAHAWTTANAMEESQRHWQVNYEGTRNLIETSGQAGVRRFVFLSTVKAMADPGEHCADEDLGGEAASAYGRSKAAAEEAVLSAGARYGMHVVNLRLAMVYGKNGRGNLSRMGRLMQKGWIPPLPETGNHRSLVHVDDVVDAMVRVADDDRASGRTYIIASHQAPSGRELYDALRAALGLPPCVWAVPKSLWRLAGRCGDRLEHVLQRRLPLDSETVSRLLDSAWYTPARIEQELGWRARIDLNAGLREMFG